MILVTTNFISGKELETIAMVKGSTVGGEIRSYTEMMDEARAIATRRMVEEAEHLGADAIIAIRYSSSAIMQGASEIMAYGTAVKFK